MSRQKKIKEVNPKYSERKTEKFLEIEGALIKIPRPKIMAKKTPIKTKLQKLSLKTEKIVNSNFVESLKENSTFHNYHQEFINEQKK